jgi:uncharacterized phage protein (TIGR01671 family)
MREIKFRAFKKETEIMYYPESTQEQFNHYLQTGSGGFWLYDKEGKLMCTSNWGDTLMQYTGLKDKNGVEIYEGDIIKRTQQIDGNFVSRKFDTYEVAYNSQIAGFEYKPIEDKQYKQYTVRPFGGEELEVIGNIHDVNPASGQAGINHMQDPNLAAAPVNQEAIQEQAAAGEAANNLESESQDKAMEAAEEGGTEG